MKNLQYSTSLICVSAIAALLLGYWVFAVAEGTENDNVAGITSSICFLVTFIPILGISHKSAPALDQAEPKLCIAEETEATSF